MSNHEMSTEFGEPWLSTVKVFEALFMNMAVWSYNDFKPDTTLSCSHYTYAPDM